MKFITIFETQYSFNSRDDYKKFIQNVEATDFVFVPKAYGSANKNIQIEMLNKITSLRSNAKIWIGTPGIDSKNYTGLPSLTTMKNFIQDVYKGLRNPSAVAGVYYNQESIYGDMNYNASNNSDFNNKEIRLMHDVKNMISSIIGKNTMIWIPYYGYGTNAATIIKKVGHVADKTNLFKYVFLQPHYLFEPEKSPNNLLGVQYSVRNNRVCYRDGAPAVSSTTSGKATIGFEMEYSYKHQNEHLYQEYKNTFSSYKNQPCGFYWEDKSGSPTACEKIKDTINEFF